MGILVVPNACSTPYRKKTSITVYGSPFPKIYFIPYHWSITLINFIQYICHVFRTQRESERRQRLIDNLNYRYKQMEIAIQNPDMDRRSALLGNPSHSIYGTNNYDDVEANGETTAARNISADEYRQQQQLLIRGMIISERICYN